MNNKEIFIETASRIGERLVKGAIWHDENCTWNIMAPDRLNPKSRTAKKELAGGTIYQGSSGIALFLLELYKITDNKNLLKTAEAAVKYAINNSLNLPNNSFGFHSGRIGIAYAAAMLGKYSNKHEYFTETLKILEPLKGNENQDHGIDVIGGAAGAIPILLILNDLIDNNTALDIAKKLGEHLISIAHMEPTGWSWGNGYTNVRNLCGLAHGAAGIGHAFIELYNFTNSSKYLYAAEQAFLYERQFLNKKTKNWPDFRHSDLGEYTYAGQIKELTEVIKKGKLPPYTIKYMNAWCHGSPGIGLTRLRAFELIRHIQYKNESEIAIEGTKNSLNLNNKVLGNYSLCHGIGGNCETIIYGSKIFNNQKLFKLAEVPALQGWEIYEKKEKPWPCGTMGSVSDPSLMLGEAGIGYYFLRLYNDNTPCILLPHLNSNNNISNKRSEDYKLLQSRYINTYFGNTLNVLDKITSEDISSLKGHSLNIGGNISDVTTTYGSILNFVKNKNGKGIDLIKDVFTGERLRYELTISLFDFTEEHLEELKREAFEELNLEESRISLTKNTRLIVRKWDWRKWSTEKNNIDKTEPDKNDNYILLYRNKNKIKQKQLKPFAYLILNSLEKASTIDEIISNISGSIEYDDNSDLAILRKTAVQQLQEAYTTHLIKIETRLSVKNDCIECGLKTNKYAIK